MNQQEIRQRTTHENEEVSGYLSEWEQFVWLHRGVLHPFLAKFAVSRNAEFNAMLFSEFYCFIRYLPFYISGMALLTRDEKILREIVVNVNEEVGGKHDRSHLNIYRDFLRDIGVSLNSLKDYRCLPTTRALDGAVKRLYTSGVITTAMGAMFALESMSSRMVAYLDDGLVAQGCSSDTRLFFTIHRVSEIGHANGVYNVVGEHLESPINKEQFEFGIKAFMKAVEEFWDGISAAIQLDVPERTIS